MDTTVSKLTILFDEPFWVGIYEREYNGCYEVSKITFGAEPKDGEVYDFILKNWNKLKFSPSVECKKHTEKQINPKRLQRLITKQTKATGIGTKAQQALQLQREQNKLEHKVISREKLRCEAERQFNLHKEKQKEKHRGH